MFINKNVVISLVYIVFYVAIGIGTINCYAQEPSNQVIANALGIKQNKYPIWLKQQ